MVSRNPMGDGPLESWACVGGMAVFQTTNKAAGRSRSLLRTCVASLSKVAWPDGAIRGCQFGPDNPHSISSGVWNAARLRPASCRSNRLRGGRHGTKPRSARRVRYRTAAQTRLRARPVRARHSRRPDEPGVQKIKPMGARRITPIGPCPQTLQRLSADWLGISLPLSVTF